MFKKLSLILVALTAMNVQAEENKDSLKVYEAPSVTISTTVATEGKSPVPFTTVKAADIKNRLTNQDIPQLLNTMPSILASSQSGNGLGYNNISLRGFDQRRISVLINGIPQNDPEDHNVYWINTSDIMESVDNIQVQRGAGLINYGAAAIGGSINLTTSNFVK